MQKINVLVAVPRPLRDLILTKQALAKLASFAVVTMNEDERNWTAADYAAHLPGVDVMISGWGMVKITPEMLAAADRLRLIAHSAGTVKSFVTDAVFDRDIRITHAAGRIADSVAEFSLLAALLGLRRPQDYDRRMKAGEQWPPSRGEALFEIRGKKVGVLGMGYVGRKAARLFQAVGAEVWAFDPYLSEGEAGKLGVHKAGLQETLRSCPIISDHLPVTEETRHMLGAAELALIQDGAVFINTARAWTVDEPALVRELTSGRFWAALDVFDKEPLPLDHPLRKLDNVLLTSHIAGQTRDSLSDLMATMIDEAERFVQGEQLRYEITREMLVRMA